MKITLWGVRGSLPTPLTSTDYREKLRRILRQANGVDLSDDEKVEAFIQALPKHDRSVIGGNTTCVEVSDDDTRIIVDAGSGLRNLGQKLMQECYSQGQGVAHILFSHHHHDHTNGFPFFIPAYIPGNEFHFYGPHAGLEDRMVGLQVREYFPVPFHVMASQKRFHQLKPDVGFDIGAFHITPTRLNHPGDAYAYRFEWRDKTFIYASDAEYKNPTQEQIDNYTAFFRDADVLYFDGQYSIVEAFIKEDWGHSSAMIGVDFCVRANVKQLIVGHHDPSYSDEMIVELQRQAVEYRDFMYPDSDLEIVVAFEGDTFDLSE